MLPHPEGGWWARSYIALSPEGERPAWSGIYYLLENRDRSHFHRLDADELWSFHDGGALRITMISPEGKLTEQVLGKNTAAGERPQVLVPKGFIFGAEHTTSEPWALVGCTVIPGFLDGKFELMPRSLLLRLYPQHRDVILRLTREDAP